MRSIFIKTLIISVVFVNFALAFMKSENDSSITSNVPGTISSGSSFFLQHLLIGKNNVGLSLGLGVSYSINNNIFTLRYIGADELNFQFIGVHPFENDSPQEKIKDIGILYGRSFPNGNKLLSFSVGISYLKGIKRGKKISGYKFNRKDIATISFPFEVQVISFVSKRFGFGLTGYVNLNKQESIYGGQMVFYYRKNYGH